MAQDIFRVKIVYIYEPGQKRDQGVICLLGKRTVPGQVAALYGYGVKITGHHRIGNLVQGHALYDLSLIADDKMCADTVLMSVFLLLKIAAVLGSTGAGICRIVHKYAGHRLQGIPGPGKFVGCKKILCPLGMSVKIFRRQSLHCHV